MERPTSDLVRGWLRDAGVNASTAARRAGVSPSTLHRILADQVDPSVGTLREIATACGLDLVMTANRLSDWRAAAAARLLLEDGYGGADASAAAWGSRLVRLAQSERPVDIVHAAALASAPLYRRGAIWFTGSTSVGRVASAGDATGGPWALSGAAGLYLPEFGEPAPPITVLWCADARTASQMLTGSDLRITDHAERTTLVVVRAEPQLFTGSFTKGLVRYAAPIQILLDCLSFGGDVARDSREEALTW